MEKGKYNILNFKLYYIIQGKNGGISKKSSNTEIKKLLLILYYCSKMIYIRLQKQD